MVTDTMHHTDEVVQPPPQISVPAPSRSRWTWRQSLVMVIAVLGICVFIYPSASTWLSNLKHQTEVDGYVETVDGLPAAETSRMLDAARAYNRDLPSGPLRDPYALEADGQQTSVDGGRDHYSAMLAPQGTDTMARIRIPSINVDLPVFHGTSESTLARGVGHLYGSSLPIGGSGTHAVLTGHSGFVQATMFDDLKSLKLNDTIVVSTLGEDFTYEVDQILTVLPNETDALRQVEGSDFLTLVTCTPTGVNTHRLLVRAERVANPSDGANTTAVIADSSGAPGFPWWIPALIGTPVAIYVLIRPKRPSSDQTSSRDKITR